MNVQFILDSAGKTTGVFIPIKEWNELKKKYKGIEQEETYVPQWQKEIVEKRMKDYYKNPDKVTDFDTAMDEIEKDL